MRSFAEGSIVKGRVLQKRTNEVLVDIGYKSEGVISLSEFDDNEELEVGSEVEVLLERLENDEGMVVLSKEKAAQKQNWEKIVKIFNDGGLISGKVKAVVKGGLMLNVGVEAFLPGSQVDIIAPKDLRVYEGKTLECKIVKLNEERKNVVLSRRELIEAERAEKRAKLLGGIEKGGTVKGTVKNITDFGAFIDLDGLDGLLHITDMSWSRLNHPSEMLKVGQEVEVLVLDIDPRKGTRFPRPETEVDESVGPDRREISGEHEGQGQGHEPRPLRRLRRTGAGHRGSRPRLRAFVDQAHRASRRCADPGPGDRGGRPRREQGRPEGLPQRPPA